MELSNNEVYTTSSNDFGKGFAFPEITLILEAKQDLTQDPRRAQVELTPEEMALAASVDTAGADFALSSGEFGGQGDLSDEGLGHEVGVSYLGLAPVGDNEDGSSEMGTDGDDNGDSYLQLADYQETGVAFDMTGFDPARALELGDELGEDLVTLAQEVAYELGGDCEPEEFVAALRNRQVELAEEDYDVELRASRLGALADPEQEAASVLRLADHGRAQLRSVAGELLLVPANADPELVVETALRARDTRLAKAAKLQAESARDARLSRSEDRAVATMFQGQIRSNMKAASERAKAGTPVADPKTEAIQGLRNFRKVWADDSRKDLIQDPARDHGFKRAFARAAVSRELEANFKKARDLGKAFLAPEVPFNGTCILPEREKELRVLATLKRDSREGSPESKAAARDRLRKGGEVVEKIESEKAEVLYIERLKSTRQALLKAQPESPAAKQAGLSITRLPKVSAFYGSIEGVAHAGSEEWFAPATTVVFGDKPKEPSASEDLRTLVNKAVDALYGRGSKTIAEPQGFDPNAWADRTPEAEEESGPDQRGAATPKEYTPAHRRDAQVVTATGRELDPPRNARQKEGAARRVELAKRKAEVGPQQAAWNLARAIHLGELEDPDERLELLLQTSPGGRREWDELYAGSKDPAELKAAARELADAGRIKTVRNQESGSLYIEATETLSAKGREILERALLRLMVTGRVSVPKGTGLARRVAAHKGVLNREARSQGLLSDIERATAAKNVMLTS